MTDKPTRRELLRPVQLLGLAFAAALFAGIVTLVSMGFFQSRFAGQGMSALMLAGVVAGITFIVTLVTIALLILAVDPSKVQQPVDRPVLRPSDDDAPAGGAPSSTPPADEPGTPAS